MSDGYRRYPKEILSLSNGLVKHFVKLREKSRYRQEMGSVLVMGSQVIRELFPIIQPTVILHLEGFEPPPGPYSVIRVIRDVMEKVCHMPQLPEWVAEFPLPKLSSLQGAKRLLVLDQVRDPGNLGTLLRTALAFGWDSAFLVQGCADPYGEKALQASKGAAFHLNLAEGPVHVLADILRRENLPLSVADLKGEELKLGAGTEKVALALGAEVQGVSHAVSQLGQAVSLRMAGPMESLNVAVAGGILMYLMGDQAPC